MRLMHVLLCVVTMFLLLPVVSAYGVTFYNLPKNPQYGLIFEMVEPNELYEMVVKDPDVSMTRIGFKVGSEYKTAGLTVYDLKTYPMKLPNASTAYYAVFELKYTGFIAKDILSMEYHFKVNKTWLSDSKISRDKISLFAYKEDTASWSEIPVQIEGDDVSFVYYLASGKGAHYLYVGKSGDATASVLPVAIDDVAEELVDASSDSKNPAVSGVSDVSQESLMEVKTVDVSAAKPSASLKDDPAGKIVKPVLSIWTLVYLFPILVVLIVVLAVLFRKKNKRSSIDGELHEYVAESMKHGKTKSEVRNRLLEVGWHPERVEKVLSKHREPSEPPVPVKKK